MKNSGKVRLGIIGAGKIAQHHLKVLASFGDVEICAVANRGAEARDKAQKEFGINAGYSDFEKMIEKEDLHALAIFVDAENMKLVTERCLDRKIPLLIEKPPTLTAIDARQLATKARRNNTPVMVALNRRFYSIFHKALDVIKEKGALLGIFIQAPEHIAEERKIGLFAPRLLDRWMALNGIHAIDLLCFFGGKIRDAHTVSRSLHEKRGDNFGALIEFENGAIGHYVSHWNSPGCWTMDLYGDGIRAHFEPLERGVIIASDNVPPSTIEPDSKDVNFKPGLWRQNRYFIDRVKDGKLISYPAASLEQAAKTMELIEKIQSGKSL